MLELTLKIKRPEDLELMVQLAERLQIQYSSKAESRKSKEKSIKPIKNTQLNVFKKMEKLREKLQAFPIPTDINLSELANEVNAA
ncbi:MAG: hypothetical protein OHK0019_01940 [Saprospiraceae bacterium]